MMWIHCSFSVILSFDVVDCAQIPAVKVRVGGNRAQREAEAVDGEGVDSAFVVVLRESAQRVGMPPR